MKDYYAILKIHPKADMREVKRARNEMLQRHHPDRNPFDQARAKERTIEILLAAEVLLDKSSRGMYDLLHRENFPQYYKKPIDRERKGDGGSADRQRAGATVKTHTAVVCPSCQKTNHNWDRSYCMFCGQGIGDNPRPFSFEDMNGYVKGMYYKDGGSDPRPDNVQFPPIFYKEFDPAYLYAVLTVVAVVAGIVAEHSEQGKLHDVSLFICISLFVFIFATIVVAHRIHERF